MIILFPCLVIIMALLALKYYRSKQKKKRLKANMTKIQEKMDKMKNIDNDLLDVQSQLEKAKKKQHNLITKRSDLQDKPSTWINLKRSSTI